LFVTFGCEDKPTAIELNKQCKYSFSGSEPFWSLTMDESHFKLSLEKEETGNVVYSQKSVNGYSIGFSRNSIHGVINQTWNAPCELSVYEEDSLGLEIYFVHDDQTYRGCGYECK